MSDILFGNATNWAGNPHNPGAADHIGSVIAALGDDVQNLSHK